MKIEYKGKPETEAKKGDIIKFETGVIGLVVNKGDWENNFCQGELAVVSLKDNWGDDWIRLSSDYQIYFEDEDYKIIGNMENAKLILGGEKEK